MSKNYIFRKFECGLSKEETAKLCFKTVRTVTGWDSGNEIPPECKRLMRFYSRKELSHNLDWKGFYMSNDRLMIPTGKMLTPQQILTGTALIEISSTEDIKTKSTLLKYARKINLR